MKEVSSLTEWKVIRRLHSNERVAIIDRMKGLS
jgi:hypothetical protein